MFIYCTPSPWLTEICQYCTRTPNTWLTCTKRSSIHSSAILHSSSNRCTKQSLHKISSPACFNRQTSPVNSEDRPAPWASAEQKQKRQRRRQWSEEYRSSIISPPTQGARQSKGSGMCVEEVFVFPMPWSSFPCHRRRSSRSGGGARGRGAGHRAPPTEPARHELYRKGDPFPLDLLVRPERSCETEGRWRPTCSEAMEQAARQQSRL